MPIYEYSCSGCGTKFEMMRSMKDSDKTAECIKCHSNKTKRLPSLFFSQGKLHSASSSGSSCSGCSGGSCSTCGH